MMSRPFSPPEAACFWARQRVGCQLGHRGWVSGLARRGIFRFCLHSQVSPHGRKNWPDTTGISLRMRLGTQARQFSVNHQQSKKVEWTILQCPSKTPATVEATSSGSGAGNTENDLALFAALERLEQQMAAGMVRARESVVALEYTAAEGPAGSRRVATGVVINSNGDVLSVRIDPPSRSVSPSGTSTEGQISILARDASGRRHETQWVAMDPETGLTLLRIAPRAVRPIQIADTSPTLGSQVFVVGNPLGLGHSVSRGHIAGLDRALKLGSHQLGGLIQVQAPLYPGDSGAAVANLRGQLLGLIRSGLAIPVTANNRAERDNDFGFAIGAHDILWVADQLRSRGRVDRAYLGVRLEPVTVEVPRPQPEGDTRLGANTDLLS